VKEGPVQQIPITLTLETLRCLLRHPALEDAPRLLSAFRSSAFPEDLPLRQITSPEHASQWIEGCQARWAEGQGFTWTVEHKQDGTILGQVTLARLPAAGAWALAFWTHPDCWGEGYATEMARRAVEFAFHELDATRVWAAAATWNAGSQRVLEKLGMAYLQDNPEGYRIDDRPVPTKEFEITRAAWEQSGQL
jgi:ribosomal-protein-alanine N-acetyltransferase